MRDHRSAATRPKERHGIANTVLARDVLHGDRRKFLDQKFDCLKSLVAFQGRGLVCTMCPSYISICVQEGSSHESSEHCVSLAPEPHSERDEHLLCGCNSSAREDVLVRRLSFEATHRVPCLRRAGSRLFQHLPTTHHVLAYVVFVHFAVCVLSFKLLGSESVASCK